MHLEDAIKKNRDIKITDYGLTRTIILNLHALDLNHNNGYNAINRHVIIHG